MVWVRRDKESGDRVRGPYFLASLVSFLNDLGDVMQKCLGLPHQFRSGLTEMNERPPGSGVSARFIASRSIPRWIPCKQDSQSQFQSSPAAMLAHKGVPGIQKTNCQKNSREARIQ